MQFFKKRSVKIILIIMAVLAVLVGGFIGYIYYQIYQIKSTIKSCELVSSDFSEKMKFTYKNRVILVKAGVNNQPSEYEFILDSGAPTILSRSFIDKLDLKFRSPSTMSVDTSKAHLQPYFIKLDQLRLGGVLFERVGAMVMDDSKLGNLNCFAEGGIIGYNVLKSCIIQINYQDTTILLTDDIHTLSHWDTTLYVHYQTRIQETPVLQATFNDSIPIHCTFDTGYNGFIRIASKNWYHRLAHWDQRKIATCKRRPPITIAGEPSAESYIQILSLKTDRFDLGPFSYHGLLVEVMDEGEDEPKALLGNEFFQNYIITLSYGQKRIYLQPVREDKLPRNKSIPGLIYHAQDNHMFVHTVYDGSQADTYGITVGDQIISINGVDVSHLSDENVCKILRQEIIYDSELDKTIHFRIEKNGTIKSFQLDRFDIF